jgi:hypothetical protein
MHATRRDGRSSVEVNAVVLLSGGVEGCRAARHPAIHGPIGEWQMDGAAFAQSPLFIRGTCGEQARRTGGSFVNYVQQDSLVVGTRGVHAPIGDGMGLPLSQISIARGIWCSINGFSDKQRREWRSDESLLKWLSDERAQRANGALQPRRPHDMNAAAEGH